MVFKSFLQNEAYSKSLSQSLHVGSWYVRVYKCLMYIFSIQNISVHVETTNFYFIFQYDFNKSPPYQFNLNDFSRLDSETNLFFSLVCF